MHQLVAQDVVEVAQGAADRQHNPAAEGLGDTAGAFGDAGHHVGLLELGRRGVEDNGCRPLSSCRSTVLSRWYHRSAIRAAASAATRSLG